MEPQFITLTSAKGDSNIETPGRECLANLLGTGTEGWNKWCHAGVRSTWIKATFTANKLYRLSGYSLCSAGDSSDKDPMAWSLLGQQAVDGKWITLHEVDYTQPAGDEPVGFAEASRWQWLAVDLPSPSPPLSALKLEIHRARGYVDGIQLGHLQFRGFVAKNFFPGELFSKGGGFWA